MADLLSKAVDFVQRQVAWFGVAPCTYVAGDARIPIPDAIKSTHPTQVSHQGPAAVEAERVDWILPAAALVWNGHEQDPQAGHQIEQRVGTRCVVYAVAPSGQDGCAYRRPDGRWRVHTRLVQRR